MIRLVEWQSFVRALDFTQLYYPLPFIRKYQNFFTLPNGVEFECLTAKWGKEKPVHLRVEVIFPDVLRLRMRQGCIMERPSDILVQDHWEAPLFHLQESESFLRLYTKRLIVDFPREPWQMKVYDRAESKQPFFEQQIADRCYGPAYEVPPIGFNEQNGLLNVVESIAVSPGEALYGFGEKFTSLNKWGQEFVSWAVDCGNVSSYRSYKNVPFWMSSRGYGVFVHTTCPIVFRIGSESALSYTFHVLADELDYFLIYGPKFKDILRRYADLTGHAPVPPKWSFGFWLSRCGYKSQREVEGIAAELRERGFPCDVISLDPWWMGEGPWTTFEWDKFNFPDPEGMIRLLK
jgi:alpha-D-xyloside xylohydrolase